VNLNLIHTRDLRQSTLLFHLTKRLLETKWQDPGGDPRLHLFGQLKRITKEWLDTCLHCNGGTYPAQLMYAQLADIACERIMAGITQAELSKSRPIRAILDPYNPVGTTSDVRFTTSKPLRHKTSERHSHVNWAILDSTWEGIFCKILENHEAVRAYVKNQNLGFEVPYRMGSVARTYLPDFIVKVDDGHGEDDLLNLVVEIKGYKGEDAKDKKLTMDTYWVPGVNRLKDHGRWAFTELTQVYEFETDFQAKIDESINQMIDAARRGPADQGK